MSFPWIKNATTGGKILIFILLVVFGMAFSSVLGLFVISLGSKNMSYVAQLQLTQLCSQVIGFIMPPLLYAAFVHEQPLNYLGFKKLQSYTLFGVLAMFTILPFNATIAEWNETFVFPAETEELLRQFQDTATVISETMMNDGNIFINLLIFGVLAAMGEELLFRSVLQKAFIRIFKNAHIGIIFTAMVFSATHMEFYGFLPRLVLGLMLGYMFYISGSIWSSMLMHFTNNAAIVILYFLNNQGVTNIDVDNFGNTNNIFLIILSLAATVAIFIFCNHFKKKETVISSRADRRDGEIL